MKKQAIFAICTTASLCLILAVNIENPGPVARAETACQVDKNTYKIGEQWKLNHCVNCMCGPEAKSTCYVFDCLMIECVDFEYTFDDCCPTCPNGANCQIEGYGIVPAGKTVDIKNGLSCTCHAKTEAEMLQFPPLPPMVICANTTTNAK